MNRFAWLMRRELWEHRAIWAAPAIVLALLLLGSVTGNVFMGDIHINADIGQDGAAGGQGALSDEDIAELESIRGVEDLHKLERLEKLDKAPGEKFNSVPAGEAFSMLPPEKRESVVAVIYALVTAVMFLVLGSIGFFYSLDALYSDRRDRSILFWKSLPLSDAETVLAKFCMAAAAIPVIAAAASIVGQLVLATGVSLKFALTGGLLPGIARPGAGLRAVVRAVGCIPAAGLVLGAEVAIPVGGAPPDCGGHAREDCLRYQAFLGVHAAPHDGAVRDDVPGPEPRRHPGRGDGRSFELAAVVHFAGDAAWAGRRCRVAGWCHLVASLPRRDDLNASSPRLVPGHRMKPGDQPARINRAWT
jgi:hypothetical protein